MTTYTQLQSDIATWLDRDDLTTLIPTFIRISEQEIYRKLRIIEMEEISYTPLSTISQYYDLPPRFIAARNIYIDTSPNKKLGYVTPEQMSLTTPSNNSNSSPTQYTIVDGKFKLDIILAASTNNLFISYYRKFAELSASNTTNWLLDNAYALLLYGGILSSELYLYNDKRIPLIRTEFARIIEELNEQAVEGRHSGGSLMIRAT